MTETPVLAEHARQRCAEMGLSTKVVKHIVRHATLVRPGARGNARLVATSDDYPGYSVVYLPQHPPLVVTVLFRTDVVYIRQGATYAEVES